MTYRQWLNERKEWIEDYEKWNGEDDELDEIVVWNGLDPTKDWIPVCCNMEIVRNHGQDELSDEQYEELGEYAREANFWDGRWDEMDQKSLVEQGKIAYEWIQGCSSYQWLLIPFSYPNKEVLYERMG